MHKRDEVVRVLLANRMFMYRYLARAFADVPDVEFLVLVRQAGEQCSLLDCEGDSRGSDLSRAINDAACEARMHDVLKTEYTRLFLGPAELPVPPWESVFTTRKQVLFQKSTLEVRAAYRRSGFEATGYPREADDHLAVELNFLGALAERALGAREAGDAAAFDKALDAHRRFLDEHLLVWIDEFAERMGKISSVGEFYPSFASLTQMFLRRDRGLIDELRGSMV